MGTGVRRRSRLAVAGRLGAAALSATVLVVAGCSWYGYGSLTDGLRTSDALSVTGKGAPPAAGDAVNLLLIGLDSRKDQNGNDLPRRFVQTELHAGSSDIGGYNTNTLILLHIPHGGGKVQAFSVPRDDYVETYDGDGRPQGMHKIKEAYGLAKAAAVPGLRAQGLTGAALEQKSREVGREATITTVQKLLGLRVDHFAEVNLLGFYDIAQVVQPITVCLKHVTSDPAMAGQGSGADFHAGLNTLDASQALAFVRQRHNLTGGDLDRTHRQQAFLASVEYKLKQQGLFSDLGRMQSLFSVVKKDVVLDDRWNVLDFAQQAPNLTGGHIAFNTLPIQGFGTRGGESVNLVDPAQIQRIVRRVTEPAPSAAPAPSSASASTSPASVAHAVVDVYNGSGVDGGAAAEADALAAAGYTRGRVANAAPAARTLVRYGSGAAAAAGQIAGRLGGGAGATASGSVAPGHVEVVLGAGFTPPPATGGGAASSGGGSAIPFQGQAVQAGGIPCVD
ncbi:LCP family protein [Phaeacidiphilus oryzae]|uniref:LCP family protein n=1 Tax=Phaeacidiphilus oryzae TaxID=348818 RepID=UPI000AFDCA84|nr:LCP family protein [Phaeacidiphilus oryzae]